MNKTMKENGFIESFNSKIPNPIKSYNKKTSEYSFTDSEKIEITSKTNQIKKLKKAHKIYFVRSFTIYSFFFLMLLIMILQKYQLIKILIHFYYRLLLDFLNHHLMQKPLFSQVHLPLLLCH